MRDLRLLNLARIALAIASAAAIGVVLAHPAWLAAIAGSRIATTGSTSLSEAPTMQGAASQWLPWAADELREPKLLRSEHGLLDVLMIAHQSPVPAFAHFNTPGWVYQICARPADGSDHCPASSADANDYGGTRLQVEPGDTLKVRLVNRLPAAPNVDPDHDDGMSASLALNPTSLHTHGLLVSPRAATPGQPAWGDNAFAMLFNPANGKAPADSGMHGPVLYDHVDYAYAIPSDHPSGLFWFHPHVHGLTQSQITGGLSGILTIGHVAEEFCSDAACQSRLAQVPQRHLLLKDAQIEADGSLAHDQDSAFCSVDDKPGSTSLSHQGGCSGRDRRPGGGKDHRGGRWIYSINGQVYPSITIGMPTGQIWRITNASANTTYDLNLWLPDEQRQLPMQVLSVDGASVDAGQASSLASRQQAQGGMMEPARCVPAFDGAAGFCTMRLHMMPASRAEIWVAYRDANGLPRRNPAIARAILRTSGYQTGPTGDNYPAIDLAKVDFGTGQVAMQGDGSISVRRKPNAATASAPLVPVASGANCGQLAPGHMRRIFFNVPQGKPDGFGLGYEEIDARGTTVPGTFRDVQAFDHMAAPLCIALAPGNKPEVERWQLVNLAGEDHSFHMHQVRFAVLSAPGVDGTFAPQQIGARRQMIDSLPLAHADGTCNSVDDWRRGLCTAHVATVEIPFTIAGDYVYHCHILEHEDGGMMATIRVVANDTATRALARRSQPASQGAPKRSVGKASMPETPAFAATRTGTGQTDGMR